MVSIPIEGKELILVSERSLERQTKRDKETKAGVVPVSNLSICYSCRITILLDVRIVFDIRKQQVNFTCFSLFSQEEHKFCIFQSLTSELGHGSHHEMQIHLFVPNPHSCEGT